MVNKRKIGTDGENTAAEYLKTHGYSILEQNYRCRLGEIDIIASKKDSIIFVEVKKRNNSRYGNAIEAVDYKKQQIIRKVAEYYLISVIHSLNINCSFDVIGIDNDKITHIKNAF